MIIATQIYEPNRIGVLCKLVDLLLDVLLGKALSVTGSNNLGVALFALASAFCTLCMGVLCIGGVLLGTGTDVSDSLACFFEEFSTIAMFTMFF